MKVVVIGGGIAGYSLGILLQKRGIQYSIHERELPKFDKGLAFLVHEDAIAIMSDMLQLDSMCDFPGLPIHEIIMKWHTDELIKREEMGNWHCMKRKTLVDFLKMRLPLENLHFGHLFSHFIYDNNQAVAAVFMNGDIEYGDVFVGADGFKSTVRKALFGEPDYTLVEVKEIVGIVNLPELAIKSNSSFTKYLSSENSLTFGMIPLNDHQMVWFTQFKPEMQNGYTDDPVSLKAFCKAMLKDFPESVKMILDATRFEECFVWYANDFDTLPSFHKENVVLIGDAAHVALPFTSAGTTNALIDASIIVDFLKPGINWNEAFRSFYTLRAPMVSKHLAFGRSIKENFLLNNLSEKNIQVPLIRAAGMNKESSEIIPKVKITYFTDPICSTCWMIQPALRKFLLHYGNSVEISYHMGGLLPTWETYSKGRIKEPNDAFEYWKELADQNTMPIFPEVWANNPLFSSFPPSIAAKAAQMQNKNKAVLYLRRLNELVFFESKNISEEKLILEAAADCGLDMDRFKLDINNLANSDFEFDLRLAKESGVSVLPTFIFSVEGHKPIRLTSYQEFEAFESALKKLIPAVKKQLYDPTPIALFNRFCSMTQYELEFLSNMHGAELEAKLAELETDGCIEKHCHHKGVLWRKKMLQLS